jgi:hypothetical protein
MPVSLINVLSINISIHRLDGRHAVVIAKAEEDCFGHRQVLPF